MTRRIRKIVFVVVAVILLIILMRSFLSDGEQAPPTPLAVPEEIDKPAATPISKPPQAPLRKITWAHNGSGLEPDPHARWGKLPNGLRYVIYPHPLPANRVSMRLLVEAGSLMEEDDQQGVAHFIEHMAFNGTANFKAGDTLERFQRLGLRNGADTNASTSFDHTNYRLDLPNNDAELIDEGMLFLRDVADGILFEPEQVELERGVILEEKRERRGKSITSERHYLTMFPDSLISKRQPIGTEAVISKISRQRLVDFYQKYYTANRMVLVVAGDVEIKRIEREIFDKFTTLAETPRAAEPELGPVNLNLGVVTSTAGAENSRRVWMRAIHPLDPQADSPQRRRLELAREIANQAVHVRTHMSSSLPNIDCYHSEHANFAASESLYSTIDLKDWRSQLRTVAHEWKRFRDLGFTKAEFEISKSNLLVKDLSLLQAQLTQSSKSIADGIVGSLVSRRVHLAPEDAFALRRADSANISQKECENEFGKLWDSEDVYVILPESIELRPSEEISHHLQRGWDDPAYPLEERDRPKEKFMPLGPPGEVIATRNDEALGASFVDFDNGVRLNFKHLRTISGAFNIRVSIPGGTLSIPADKRGIDDAMEYLYLHGGSHFLSGYDLRHAYAGRLVNCRFSTKPDSFRLFGIASSDQLGTQLRLMCARLTETNWKRGDDIWNREQTRRELDASAGSLDRQWWLLTGSTVFGWDDRFTRPTGSEVIRHSTSDVEKWMRNSMEQGSIEVTIVGDISLKAAIEEVALTFGSLRSRTPIRAVKNEIALAAWPKGHRDRAKFNSADDAEDAGAKSARLELVWRTEQERSHAEHLKMNLLVAIVGDRIRNKIREAEGQSYSPSASYYHPAEISNLQAVLLRIPAKNSELDAVALSTRKLIEQLQLEGVTKDELKRAARPTIAERELKEKNPSYWMRLLDRSGAHPEQLLVSDDVEVLKTTTVDEINNLAREWLKIGDACEFRYLPE